MNLKGIDDKDFAKQEIGKIVVEGIQDHLDRSESPVENGKYKVTKVDGERSILLDENDMRPAIEAKPAEGDYIEVGVFDEDEVRKAYGHNSGFKGHPNESKMRKHQREFIPAANKKFKESIMERVDKRIQELKRGETETRLEPLRTTTIAQIFENFEKTATSGVATGETISSTLITFPTIEAMIRAMNGER